MTALNKPKRPNEDSDNRNIETDTHRVYFPLPFIDFDANRSVLFFLSSASHVMVILLFLFCCCGPRINICFVLHAKAKCSICQYRAESIILTSRIITHQWPDASENILCNITAFTSIINIKSNVMLACFEIWYVTFHTKARPQCTKCPCRPNEKKKSAFVHSETL